MHLYFIPRGIQQQMDLFDMFLQTQMFVWERKNLKTKKKEKVLVQGSLRKIGFIYEYVFPRESLDEVLTMLNIKLNCERWNLGKFRGWIIRNMLGKGTDGFKVEKIPKYKEVNVNRYIEQKGVAIYPIGIRKDTYMKVKDWGYEQELL